MTKKLVIPNSVRCVHTMSWTKPLFEQSCSNRRNLVGMSDVNNMKIHSAVHEKRKGKPTVTLASDLFLLERSVCHQLIDN